MNNIGELAKALHMSDESLNAQRKTFRMEHGDQAEAKLLSHLRGLWDEHRDRVMLLGKQGGYVETFAAALHVKGVEAEQEPEAVPANYQTVITLNARARRAAEAEQSARAQQKQLRSFNEAMKQKIRQGEDITAYLARAQRAAQDSA